MARALAEGPGFNDMLPSLALGALDDPDVRVRHECLDTLWQFYSQPFKLTLLMIAKTLPMERDRELQLEKRSLLEAALFPSEVERDRVSALSTEDFSKACQERIAYERSRYDGDLIIVPRPGV